MTGFKGKAFEIEQKGIATTIYKKKGSTGYEIYSEQMIGRKGFGIGRTKITYPEFRYIGGELTGGIRRIETVQLFHGKIIPATKGKFEGIVLTKPIRSAYIQKLSKGYLGEMKTYQGVKPTKEEFGEIIVPSSIAA